MSSKKANTQQKQVEKKPLNKKETKTQAPKQVEKVIEQPISMGLEDKIKLVQEIFGDKFNEEEILHALKENDYDQQVVIENFFDGKYNFVEVHKKEKKKAETKPFKKTRGDKPFVKNFDKEKKVVAPKKIESGPQGPVIKSYKQPTVESTQSGSLSYSQIVAEKPKEVKKEEQVKVTKGKKVKIPEPEPEPVQQDEEEEEEEEVNLNPSYDDFAEDQSTVILPESTNVFFSDDLQFGSLSLNEKDSKGSQDGYGWDTRNYQQPQQLPQQQQQQQQQGMQYEKKKQHHQKFVPNQQQFYPNPYMNPYMNPNMYSPYFKNPYQQQGHVEQQQQQPQQPGYYAPQQGKDDKKMDNFDSHDMQGFNPYGGMPFHMYNPYTPQYVQPQVNVKKGDKHHDGDHQKTWGGKNFGN